MAAFRLTRRHLWVVALLVLIGVVASSGWTMRARAVEVGAPVTVSSRPPATLSVAASTNAPHPSPPAMLTVHVLGAVARPGVVTLPAPARVRDAIAAAGGLRSDADPAELNLAALIVDGAQIIVGTTAQPRGEVRGGNGGGVGSGPPTVGSSASGGLLDLNSATLDQLDQLPGVGPVTAQAILAWRTQHGRFTSVAELQEVDGIGPKTYAQIAPHVRV